MNTENAVESAHKKLILIDDDPIYRTIMLRAAEQEGIDLEVYASLVELYATNPNRGAFYNKFDGAIVDFDFGTTTGVEIADCLVNLFGDISLLLVSQQERVNENHQWPRSISKFLKKTEGYRKVLLEAIKCGKKSKNPVYGNAVDFFS